jgi:signal transduction histidine kinase
VDTWLRPLAPGGRLRNRGRTTIGQPLAFDLILALLLAGAAVVVPLSAENGDFVASAPTPDGPIDWLIIVGAAWAVPFRRIAPLTALLVGAALQMVVWTIGYPDTFLATAVLLYSAAVQRGARHRRLVWAVAALMTTYTAFGVATTDVPLYAIPLVGLFSVSSVAFGSTIAARQAYAEAAEFRALELERSRQVDRDRALAEERARIARELHDVVAHGLSVIVVQAAAARRILERDPDGAATALNQIERTGRDALSEMRHVLSAIRTEPEDSWQPSRGLADLDALVAELHRTGLPVAVERRREPDEEAARGDGTPWEAAGDDRDDRNPGPDLGPLPATVDVTAYRIVRESLTNVLKHGGAGATARVDIVRRPDLLQLRVTDTGRGAMAEDGGGHGLRGMQERVEVFGGRFSAGPRLGGGFTVDVALPLDATRPVDRAVPVE